MIQKTLQQITDMMDCETNSTFSNVTIEGVCIDSRKVEQGNLFIPFKGENVDGHQYVRGAIEKGAAASLWQKDVPNPPNDLPILIVDDPLVALQQLARAYREQLHIKIVGVTGSNGKTTTKDMITNLLSTQYSVQKTEGNYNNHIGLPLTILSLKQDTEVAVLEMGMSAKGEIDFLTKLARPDIAVITNIGEAHLQDLGSREAIAEAKLEITNGLHENGLIVYFGDEPLLTRSLARENRFRICTFGYSDQNTLYPVNIHQSHDGSVFSICGLDNVQFELPVLGKHNVLNALAAMLVANELDVSFESMKESLRHVELTKMRMEIIEGQKGERIINDAYNASPTSMKAAIELITYLEGFEEKIVVLGDMLELGPDEKIFHEEVGKSMNAEKIEYVFTYGPLGEHIARGALTVFPKDRVFSFRDKQKLIDQLRSVITGKEIILVKASRGMKLEEVVQSLKG
ncbi:UDP-N-acetylmuramoyl-tripeptide--D-alanyl-D-alanine ligase [Oikeobacillus pervagus]|uniref:UDP-N-acetylmuramoyl-tripeptide--D-alanyl-D-alanine ligase n=1 Tax=Oikeobacillus pervagus TaxID=1325931 RepID=A0AAJ1T0I8_9BACI|nr:UDP-N-acetylmuramoyl-tripeptide--D-alanyl-D-alanine ligase [Oikeobacillus pervagus]MDQ0216308.1 UDP-N-acetylmuramoyl-tripeptide--D-alanyl-D-alanine ligase [Oikeobacillus pervagus]